VHSLRNRSMGLWWSRSAAPEAPAAPLEREPSPSFNVRPDGGYDSSAGGHMEWTADQQTVWVPDAAASRCMICHAPFSWLFRRHHCRQCGSLVCQDCSPHRAVARGFQTPVRVCVGCMGALVLAQQSAAQSAAQSRRESRRGSVDRQAAAAAAAGTQKRGSAQSSQVGSRVGSRAGSQASSRRTSPSRLVSERHAEYKAEQERQQQEQASSSAVTAEPSVVAPSAVHVAPLSELIRTHHTSASSTEATAAVPAVAAPRSRPASPTRSSLGPVHASTLSLSVGGASTVTEAPSPLSAAAPSNQSPRLGIRRMSVSREGSPSSHSPARRKSISGQPAFQPEASAAAAAASAPASSPSASSRFKADSLPPLVLFNRLGGFGSLLVLDVRSADEYKKLHVPRSLNIPLTDGDLLAAEEKGEGELQPAECTALLQALEQRLHMTDQRAFRMRQRCTVVIVGLPYSDENGEQAAMPLPSAYSTAPFLSSHHNAHALHLARLLQGEGKIAAASVLAGGFDAFARPYPFVCCAYTAAELRSGKHIHKKPFPYFPNEIISAAAASHPEQGSDAVGGVIYLGSKVDASNLAHLQLLGVTHVLNCTAEIPCHFEEELAADGSGPAFVYKRIELADEVSVPIHEHFGEAFEFLDAARAANSRVLVHCQEGISRSSTILIAYLMSRHGMDDSASAAAMTLHAAYSWVKAQRKQIFPNLGFWRQLSTFELTLQRERLLEEARARGEADPDAAVPPLTELKGTLDDCVDIQLLVTEYKARKAAQAEAESAAAAAAASSGASDSEPAAAAAAPSDEELTPSQRVARAVFSPNSNTLKAVKGVASEDARERAQEAIVEEAQTPCGPIVTSD